MLARWPVGEAVAGRRPGPRSDVDVREIVLDAAEAMIGDTNPDAVSLRAIARAADVAPRAVAYHFGSKRGLLEAVIRRRSGTVTEEIRRNLDRLSDTANGEPSLREVIEAVLRPIVRLLDEDPVGGIRWMRIYAAMSRSEDLSWINGLGPDPDLPALVFQATAMALGEHAGADAQRRTSIAMVQLFDTLSRVDQPVFGTPLGPRGLDPGFVEQLLVLTSAGIAGRT